jgi:hypothetical protein
VIFKVHLAVAGGEDGVVGAAFELEMTLGFYRGSGVVVDDFVGVDDVVLVVKNDFAGESGDISCVFLTEGFPVDGNAG